MLSESYLLGLQQTAPADSSRETPAFKGLFFTNALKQLCSAQRIQAKPDWKRMQSPSASRALHAQRCLSVAASSLYKAHLLEKLEPVLSKYDPAINF